MRLAACFFLASCSAFAQVEASRLRTQYGAPLDRETFMVRPRLEMVVDYGPSKRVCRIQLPSGRNVVGTVPPGTITRQQIDEVLNEVAPPSVLGKN